MKNIHLRIHGRVQGVFFRSNTELKAREFNITGFVRNDPDGTVVIEAEGEEGALESFLKWCHKGPKGADVKKIETEEGEIMHFTVFEIRY